VAKALAAAMDRSPRDNHGDDHVAPAVGAEEHEQALDERDQEREA